MLRLGMALLLLAAVPARADGPPLLSLDGLFDGYLLHDSAQGVGPVAGLTSGTNADLPTVNLIDLGASLHAGGLHARLLVGAGASLDALHAPDPTLPRGDAALRHLMQAFVGYTIPIGRGLTIDAGLLPSHIGFETFATVENWNYTRAWMAEYSPYYQAGVRIAYPFTAHLSAQLLWLNGWGLIDQDRGFRSAGAQIAWSSERFTASINLFVGPPRPGDGGVRGFVDAWGQVAPVAQLRLGAALDGGFDHGGARDATWWAAGTYVRFQPWPQLAGTVRMDLIDDRSGGAATGRAQRLAEGTLTVEVPAEALLLRGELRIDRGSEPSLEAQTGRTLFVVSLAGRFG